MVIGQPPLTGRPSVSGTTMVPSQAPCGGRPGLYGGNSGQVKLGQASRGCLRWWATGRRGIPAGGIPRTFGLGSFGLGCDAVRGLLGGPGSTHPACPRSRYPPGIDASCKPRKILWYRAPGRSWGFLPCLSRSCTQQKAEQEGSWFLPGPFNFGSRRLAWDSYRRFNQSASACASAFVGQTWP